MKCSCFRLLWQFVSKFTDFDAKKLHKLYKRRKHGASDKKDNETSVNKGNEDLKAVTSSHDHKKENKKDKKKMGEESEEKSTSSHKRKYPSSAKEETTGSHQPSPKKPYNGWSATDNRSVRLDNFLGFGSLFTSSHFEYLGKLMPKAHGREVTSVFACLGIRGSRVRLSPRPFHFRVLKRSLIGLLLVVKLGVMFSWCVVG